MNDTQLSSTAQDRDDLMRRTLNGFAFALFSLVAVLCVVLAFVANDVRT